MFGVGEHLITDDYARCRVRLRNIDAEPRCFKRGDAIGTAEGLSHDSFVCAFGETEIAAIFADSSSDVCVDSVKSAKSSSRTEKVNNLKSQMDERIRQKVRADIQ